MKKLTQEEKEWLALAKDAEKFFLTEKDIFIAKYGEKEWQRMEKRREEFRQQHIKRVEEKYYKTGNKKYLHVLSGMGVDVDYSTSDMRG